MRAVNLMTPGGLDEFLEGVAGLGENAPDSAMERLSDRHGVTWVGPPLRVKLGLA